MCEKHDEHLVPFGHHHIEMFHDMFLENEPTLRKDMLSGVVVNVSKTEIENARARKIMLRSKKNEIEELKNEVGELKDLVNKLIEKL